MNRWPPNGTTPRPPSRVSAPTIEGGSGDFLRVPAGAVHRESNPGDQPARAVIVRCGTGDPTYNVEGPASS